jgi:LacI family transcriptional regulator
MFEKRHRITLLFNANKAYDRQVVEGVGEYLQASQSEWDIFIEEDFRTRLENIKDWLGDGVIADYDDPVIEQLLTDVDVPIVGVGGSYHSPEHYPPVHYIATDNHALVEAAFLHLKEKGVHRFAFYGLPATSGKRWAVEREHAFCQLVAQEKYRGVVSGAGNRAGKLAARAKPPGGLAANAAAANRYYRRDGRPRAARAAGLRTFTHSGARKAVRDWH